MVWILTAALLLLWLGGVLLQLGSWVNVALVLAAVLLVYRVVAERQSGSRR